MMKSILLISPAMSVHESQRNSVRRFFRLLVSGLAGLLLCGAVQAANPDSWWVDIANDRVDKVRQALAQGADPNEISPDGQPAIMQAIRDGAWKVYDVLAAHPTTARNAINKNRETPLMYLAVVGQTKRAQDLINKGAMVNRLGWTPLQYAASKGHLDTVKMLVANKAIVNAPGPDGTTALMMAAYGGSEAVVQYLLNHGADPTMQTLQQYDAAKWARLKNHNALADKLDAVSAKVLAQRTGTAPTKPAGANRQAAGAATIKPEPASSAKGASDSSTSRYFDLDRFNEEATP